MKTSRRCAVVSVVLALSMWPAGVLAESDGAADARQVYEAVIEDIISNCSAKCPMAVSEHGNVSAIGLEACRKAKFCAYHKDRLVDEMTRLGLPAKAYRVNRFVNEEFLDSVSYGELSEQ